MRGLKMTNKNFTVFYSLFLFSIMILTSCSDDSANTGPLNITGEWDSDGYAYYPNCEGEGINFENYINDLIQSTQESQAQNYVDFQCSEEQLGSDFCNSSPYDANYETNADSMFTYYLNTLIIPEWDNNPSYAETIEIENTHITEVMDIGLNINADNTYTISWDGTCIDYPDFSEDECNALSAAEWNGALCEILTQEGCESIFVEGTWDDGSSGVLDENGDNYTMNDVTEGSLYDGLELTFDGNTISITVVSEDDLCIKLMFDK